MGSSPRGRVATRDLVLSALFTALIAVGAFLRIPLPAVPFTLQTLFVALSGLLLGARRGAISAACYLALGLIGLPIFAAGGGISYVLKPSFGYILGFILGAFLTGSVAAKKTASYTRLFFAGCAGLLGIYAVGLLYYAGIAAFVLHAPVPATKLLLTGFLVTLPGDVLSMLLAAWIALRLRPVLGRR